MLDQVDLQLKSRDCTPQKSQQSEPNTAQKSQQTEHAYKDMVCQTEEVNVLDYSSLKIEEFNKNRQFPVPTPTCPELSDTSSDSSMSS